MLVANSARSGDDGAPPGDVSNGFGRGVDAWGALPLAPLAPFTVGADAGIRSKSMKTAAAGAPVTKLIWGAGGVRGVSGGVV